MSDSFEIAGIKGFKLKNARRKVPGGQVAGIPPAKIRVYHDDLGYEAIVVGRNQMKARDLAIYAIGSLIEAEKNFSYDDIREEVDRLTSPSPTEEQ